MRGSGYTQASIVCLPVVDLFRSCDLDLDLDPMTFIYELDPYCPKILGMCKYELHSYMKSVKSYRETYLHAAEQLWYIQTDRIDQSYKPCHFVGGQEKHSLWQRCDQRLSRPVVIRALFLTFLLLTIGDF